MDRDARLGDQRGRDDERGGRGEVAGDIDLVEAQALGWVDADRARTNGYPRARVLEHQLGVVARRRGLDDGRLASCAEPCEQDRRFQLGARDRQLVVDRLERRAGDAERQVPVGGLDLRSHQPQRLGDALHRTRRERFVAGEREAAFLEREQAHDETRECARVATVDRRGLQAAQADTAHDEPVVVVVDVGSERTHRRERGHRVAGTPEPADDGVSIRDRAEQQGPVRDRLVARDREMALEPDRRLNPHR